MSWLRLAFLVVALSGAVPVSGASAAAAAQIFTVAGGDSVGSPDRGRLATDAAIFPVAVLGLPDGGFAFFDGATDRVLRVDPSGRIGVLAGDGRDGSSGDGGPAVRARLRWGSDLALDPGGGILIADEIAGRVRLVRPDGIIVTLAGGGHSTADGIPAANADLYGVQGVAVAPDGAILAAVSENARVRRISPDGTIGTFAGTGHSGSSGDGGLATDAQLKAPSSLAVASDGSVYISTVDSLRRVDSAGVISTVARPFPLAPLAATPLGLVAASGLYGTNVAVINADGTQVPLAGGGPISGFDGDGDSPLRSLNKVDDISAAADGGLLISDYKAIRYVPPEHPRILAVAITRPTLTSPQQLRVSLATTLPAKVTLRVTGNGANLAPVRTSVQAGDTTIKLGRHVKAGAYLLRAMARGANGQLASDQLTIFPGGVLSAHAAREVAAREVEAARALLQPSPPGHVGKCRSFGRRRVDCQVILRGRGCWEVASIRLHRDGLPYLRTYDDLLDGVCTFRRHPTGSDEPAP